MIKKFLTLAAVTVFIVMLPCVACAQSAAEEPAQRYYSEVWNTVDGSTRDLLKSIGAQETDFKSILNITPDGVLKLIENLFSSQINNPLKSACVILCIMILVALCQSFIDSSSSLGRACEGIGVMCILFSVIASCAQITADCRSCIELSKDFMLGLIPVLAGVIAFSGNPSLALSFNSVVFSFAQSVSVLFCSAVPSITAAGTAVSAAGALNPDMKTGGIPAVFNKAVCIIMGLFSGVFVAVLSIRGIIAGAADTVTIRGLRFLVGNAVPVIGSAIGDALNSLIAGIGLVKHSIGALGILCLLLINLPALCTMAVWRVLLYLLSILADIMGQERVSDFMGAVNSLFGVITAVVCFNMFVYIISTAIILTVKAQ